MTQFSTMHDAPEHESAKERLREAEKLEIIGRLAGGVAHDFNNLLTGVLLYCDLMRAELARERPDTAGLIRHIEEIRAAGEQGAALTQQLLAAARKQPADPRPLQLNLIVASMANLLRKLMGEPIELILTLDPSAGAVLADESQMQQVVLNLALNARDAMPRGGKIRIITRAAEFPVAIDHRNDHRKRKASASVSSSVSSSVSLAVKDNGCGMDEEARKRLFEPFFTTKDPGKGTGLGLATVQRIVSEAGGVIEVQSEAGRGTCVEIFFPAMVAAETRLAASAGANERGAGPVST
ncbi:MAG TPA: ATP-binding protein [Terriglobales bacterium]|nr:ATP-binding protein [Terriglobales bacterium]